VCPCRQYEHNITFYSDIYKRLNYENMEEFKAQIFLNKEIASAVLFNENPNQEGI